MIVQVFLLRLVDKFVFGLLVQVFVLRMVNEVVSLFLELVLGFCVQILVLWFVDEVVLTRVDLHVRVIILLEMLRIWVFKVGVAWQIVQVVVLPVLGRFLRQSLFI